MADLQLLDCFQPELVRLERVRFFQRQLLTVADMVTEQDYIRQKLRRHNRFLHGWGVVGGLEVIPQPTDDAPWRVEITAGYALGPYGDEVYVGESVFLDLAQCGPDALTSPCEPDVLEGPSEVSGGTLYVAIKYAECVTQPVRAMPAGCACDDIACEYSRIRDSFELSCLTELPPSPTAPLLCDLISENSVPPCPPCPEEPWVVLASVTLPAPGVPVADDNVDNLSVRRQLYSTAMLQHQLIDCCCGPQDQVEADLAVEKRLENDVLTGGTRQLTYLVNVTNHGPAPAANVVVTDTIDITNGAAVRVDSVVGNWTPSGPVPPTTHQVVVANLGTVQPGPMAQLRFTVFIRPAAAGGPLSVANTVTVTSATTDGTLANNTSSTANSWPN
ncbi:MAG: DUF11 domain-containing protein [Vicinamibacterales bacterium]